MKLDAYLKQTKQTENAFSRHSGVPQSVLNRIAHGYDATGKNWARIQYATDGQVKVTNYYTETGKRRC